MNKQELIEQIKCLKNISENKTKYVGKDTVIKLISELDEPQKVVVPQFVAQYIEWTKGEDYHLLGAMTEIRSHKNKEIDEWFEEDDNMEIFACAWLDGYEVEKEKRYRVRFKGFNCRYVILKYDKYDKTWFVGGELEFEFYRAEHTHKELEEADFGWMFDCPGIEIEEVE